MTDEELLNIVQHKLYNFSGIKIAETQKKKLWESVIYFAQKAGLSVEEYCNKLSSEHNDFPLLINEITVNETYFFREEKQFNLLKETIFPRFKGKSMNIWSGACSSGEEAVSLLILALSCNVDAQIFATDIDDNAINKLKRGIYTQYSFRNDGKKYHELLVPYYEKKGDEYHFDAKLLERIKVCKYNLKEDSIPFTEKMDVVFLRNVFIYFDRDTRIKISRNICSSLNNQGCLFFSMNEIGCIDDKIVPSSMYKTNIEYVYFFVKGNKPAVHKIESLLENTKNKIEESRSFAIRNRKPKINLLSHEKTDEKPAAVVKPVFNMQDYFNRVSREINNGKYENAKTVADEIKSGDNKSFYYFLNGYIEYHADNKEIAEKMFSTSLILKTDFWPVYFYHGMVLKDMGMKEKSDLSFKKCIELLDSNEADCNKYDFVLDSFSSKYIHSLCESMLKV